MHDGMDVDQMPQPKAEPQKGVEDIQPRPEAENQRPEGMEQLPHDDAATQNGESENRSFPVSYAFGSLDAAGEFVQP